MKAIIELEIESIDTDSFYRFIHLLKDFIHKNTDGYLIKKVKIK